MPKPLTLAIPPEFITSGNKFISSMDKFVARTRKMQTAHRTPAQSRPRHDPSSFISQFRRMSQNMTRFENVMARSVSKLSTDMGPFGRQLLRSLDVESILSKIPQGLMEGEAAAGIAARGALGVAAGPVGAIAIVIAEVIKAVIEKTISLAPMVFRDSAMAWGFGTTISGSPCI